MRLVLDTNTALPGLLWGGTPGRLLDAALDGRVELASSTALLAELQGVLSRPKFNVALAKRGLAAALAAQADLIVSGDVHLLDLKQFQAIPIVTARDALGWLAAARHR